MMKNEEFFRPQPSPQRTALLFAYEKRETCSAV
jgi:hypothetical protein